MQDKRIRSILVVGGGTAGWLSAAYLERALGKTVKVTLVESDKIGRIGVGEATVSSLRFTMNYLGFSEDEWMPQVGGTYKTAVRFEQWNQPASEGLEYFYHPFFERNEPMVQALAPFMPDIGEGQSLMHFWLKRHLAGDTTPYAYAVFPGPKICDLRKAPRFKGNDNYEIPSAFHLDAYKFQTFLSKKVKERGVQHVIGDINEVLLDEQGAISGVRTEQHGVLSADLYVDCSGFRSVLLGSALEEPFDSAKKHLWCNAAVALRPRNAPGDLEPYTLARASDAGWMWNIPLYHRSGTGYVYCNRYKTKEEAEKELRAYLGDRADEETHVNHLTFDPGRRQRAWVKNCVGIGLAANFIEPLESTTIFLIEYALANLLTYFPDKDFAPARAERYNRIVASMFDEIRDFIVLHFISSNRRDTPFWRDYAEMAELPGTLARDLEFFKENLPTGERFKNFVFRERSYACLLAGMKRLPKKPYPLLEHLSTEVGDRALKQMAIRTDDLAARLPGQREYLEDLYARAGMKFVAE